MGARAAGFRAVLAIVVVGVAAVLAGPAATAAPGDVVYASAVSGDVTYQLRRVVDGQPGNAHSGRVTFQLTFPVFFADDPMVSRGTATMLDWDCPAGVRPPTDLPAAGSACTLLRSRSFVHLTGPTMRGSLAATWSGPFALHQDLPTVTDRAAAPFYLAFHRRGPLRTKTEVIGDPPFTVYTLVRSTMELTGRLDWLRLQDPGLSVRFHDYVRETDYGEPF